MKPEIHLKDPHGVISKTLIYQHNVVCLSHDGEIYLESEMRDESHWWFEFRSIHLKKCTVGIPIGHLPYDMPLFRTDKRNTWITSLDL